MIYEKLSNEWISGKFGNSYILVANDLEKLLEETERFLSSNIFQNINSSLENNPDYLILSKEIVNNKEQKYINVSQSRSAIDFFSKTSWVNGNKVLLISKSHELNENASNALLKLLEDTPKNCYIFLLTNNANYIIGTIRSRSRIIYDYIIDDKKANDFSNLAKLNDYIEKDVEKFFKEVEAEGGKKIWEIFVNELTLALHNIILDKSNISISLSTEENKLEDIIKMKSLEQLIELNDKIKYFILNCDKYDLSKRHIFYLIAETIRN